MSNYRDDIQETAIASSSTWGGLKTITGESAKIAAATIFTLGVLHADQATAGDQVIDQGRHVVHEQAVASDEAIDHLHSTGIVHEAAAISERYAHRITAIHSSSAVIGDGVIESIASILTDSATVSDLVIDRRSAFTLIEEQARVSDFSGQATKDLIHDTLLVGDESSGVLRAFVMIEDQASASDSIHDKRRDSAQAVVDAAVARGEVFDSLHAYDLVSEWASVTDEVVGGADAGQAWTACVDGWAMSRYQPYTFSRIAVIDGVLYGETENGVYALSGGSETVTAKVRTGKLDMSGGPLTHPVAAYLEYELAGTAEMDVTTTQTGTPQSYTYSLPPEPAEHLTNGRFQFGRGLRGRHFTFELRITGEHGRVNDLSIQTAQGRRRI